MDTTTTTNSNSNDNDGGQAMNSIQSINGCTCGWAAPEHCNMHHSDTPGYLVKYVELEAINLVPGDEIINSWNERVIISEIEDGAWQTLNLKVAHGEHTGSMQLNVHQLVQVASYEPTPEYQAFLDEEEAIHTGRAVQLTHCYLCYLEATGKPDFSPKQDQGPLRGIIRRSVSSGSDPYEVQHLNCGHGLI